MENDTSRGAGNAICCEPRRAGLRGIGRVSSSLLGVMQRDNKLLNRPGKVSGQSRYVFFPKISATAPTVQTPDGIFILSVTFGHVPKGRLASLPRTFQTDFMASVKRSDGFKKTVRRKVCIEIFAISLVFISLVQT